jgi:hypothetical protein
VYVGVVVGIGADRLTSVAVMKFNDQFVQNTFNALFQVPKAPVAPIVNVAELDGEFVLEWGSDLQRVADTETRLNNPGGYVFEGYNVYQLPSRGSQLSEGRRIITFDLLTDPTVILDQQFDPSSGQILSLPVQFGSNSGIERTLRVTRDYVRDIEKLWNGQEYHYVVTAYSRATVPGYLPAALESDPTVITVQPKRTFGRPFEYTYGDTVKTVTHTAGASDGGIIPMIVSPGDVTGKTYSVGFRSDNSWWVARNNGASSDTIITGATDQNGSVLSPIADGLMWRVLGAPNDAKDFRHVAGPSGAINPATYVGWSTFNSLGFPDPSGQGNPVADWGGGTWGIQQGGGANGSYATFTSRVFRNDNFSRFVPNDYELRFTAAGGFAYLAFTTGAIVPVPFELWCIGSNTPNDASDDYRMIPWINDADGNGAFNLMPLDHNVSGADNDPYTDWIYWMEPNPKTPGSAGYNAFVADSLLYDAGGAVTGTGSEVMARIVLVSLNAGSVATAFPPATIMPPTGNVIRIISTKPNTTADVFSVNTAPYYTESTIENEKISADRVGVFPNPYYAYNPQETSRFARYVTFNNLPPEATIRIFNLAGQLVRVLSKNDDRQFVRWDLTNHSTFPVASGMYVAHVEMKLPSDNSTTTKVLKFAVIQEQEILNSY